MDIDSVHNCLQEDKLSELKATLKNFPRAQRKAIVERKKKGNAPLFTACLQGKVHFVRFLLDECDADVEQKGVYKVEGDLSRHKVTPLWCAAVANKLEVAKALVLHGAEINSPSDTDSTPVRSACYMSNVAMIEFLVDNGANIHKPNVHGGTCLINSVQNPSLCLFLINKGADVNARDNDGNLALHYAIREGLVETVKLLLKYGSDYKIKNNFLDDPVQVAALLGHQDIVEVMLEMTNLDLEDAVRAYELLGTHFVDAKNDIGATLKVWKKAMSLRYLEKGSPLLKDLPAETNYVYCHFRELNTIEELENLYDPEEIFMQALLIRERVLGHRHKETTFGLMYRGAVYADSLRYQRCVDLWKYAYIIRHRKCDPMNQDCLFTIQALVKLFWEIQVEVESSLKDEVVKPADPIEVLGILTEQIKDGQELMRASLPSTPTAELSDMEAHKDGQQLMGASMPSSSTTDHLYEFVELMEIALHLIHLISRLKCNQEETNLFLKYVRRLVSLDPRGSNSETMLHLSLDPLISLKGEKFVSKIPSLKLIQILVACGADENAVTTSGDTPLLHAQKTCVFSYNKLHKEGILNFLLSNSAHIDKCNSSGKTALEWIEKQYPLTFCRLKYLTLKCLASRVIMKDNIPFRNKIPSSLVPFVEMHGARQENS